MSSISMTAALQEPQSWMHESFDNSAAISNHDTFCVYHPTTSFGHGTAKKGLAKTAPKKDRHDRCRAQRSERRKVQDLTVEFPEQSG
jgi:hypothetical protein